MDIDNVHEKDGQVSHEYAIGNQLYVEITDIYRKVDNRKQGLYIIAEIFTNGTAQFK